MVRKWILAVVACLLLAGCGESQVSTWVLTGQDTDTKALVGVNMDGVEVGGVATWHPIDDATWGPEPTGAGFYVGADVSWILSAEDTPNASPIPISFLDGLNAVPYGRIEWLDDCDNGNFSNLEPQFIGGMRFLLDEKGRVALVAEHSSGEQAPDDVYIGANLRF